MEINKVPYETSSLAEIKIIKFFSIHFHQEE